MSNQHRYLKEMLKGFDIHEYTTRHNSLQMATSLFQRSCRYKCRYNAAKGFKSVSNYVKNCSNFISFRGLPMLNPRQNLIIKFLPYLTSIIVHINGDLVVVRFNGLTVLRVKNSIPSWHITKIILMSPYGFCQLLDK